MEAFNKFLAMGGYAGYVWSSYGIALVLFAWGVAAPLFEKRKLIKRIQRMIEQQQSSQK